MLGRKIIIVKEQIGIGIIGTGFARKVQIPAFLACSGAKVVSVASGSVENAEAAGREFGVDHATADWRETVDRPDVDLVCITRPPKLHLEMTLFALERGKAVLCEKPMAMNVAEAEEMTRAAADKGVLALIDHELRFQNGRQLAYKMLRDGAIGKVRHAKAIFHAPHRGDPTIPWNWWSDAGQGGGALGAIASHIIDSFLWLLDTDISSVACQLHTHVKHRIDSAGSRREVTSDDESNMLLRFAPGDLVDDATGLVSISMIEGPEYDNRLEFYADGGSMRILPNGELFISGREDAGWRPVAVDAGKAVEGVPDTGFSRAFMAFAPVIVDALRTGKTSIEHAATFADGTRVQRVLDAARESDRSGFTSV